MYRLHTRSLLLSSKATFTVDSALRSNLSTNITLPEVYNINLINFNNSGLALVN
jgi:hypothetical protein